MAIDGEALATASANVLEAKQKLVDVDARIAAHWKQQEDATVEIQRIEESMLPLAEQRELAAARLADAEKQYYDLFDGEKIDLDALTKADLARVEAKKRLFEIDQEIAKQQPKEEPTSPAVAVPQEGFFSKELRGDMMRSIHDLSGGLAGLVMGTQKWGDVWRQVALNIIQSLIQMAIQATIFRAIMAFSPALGAFLGIASMALAGGGTFVTNGPTHLTVGDNPGGAELVSVIPLSGVGQSKVNGHAIQMGGGGTALVAGGGRTADNVINYSQTLNFGGGINRQDLLAAIPSIVQASKAAVLDAQRRHRDGF